MTAVSTTRPTARNGSKGSITQDWPNEMQPINEIRYRRRNASGDHPTKVHRAKKAAEHDPGVVNADYWRLPC
jgi:hypothetical protein